MLALELEAIKDGLLESIINNKNHPARQNLIWQNCYFEKLRRRKVTIPCASYAENAPLSLDPHILEYLEEYIFLPANLKEAYRCQAKKE
ncbi:hypothetical protein [Nitrosomonas sp. Nm166]|uniref:hypothetical protein n=1 Tax=Nitrosomonas sp. Nm166 TaxID=1881054 RepID=UPI0008EE5124|nr:hypothetical protein [Nitrosomonas sp. Nm166]SFE71065.1 hypothetical protein SAMN05428977_102648 [Nitrosomonas sp. Nm166]